MECPSCGVEIATVLAQHSYSIKWNEEQWVKSVGEVEYRCSNCLEELDTHDIEDILRQVDEL